MERVLLPLPTPSVRRRTIFDRLSENLNMAWFYRYGFEIDADSRQTTFISNI